MKTAFRCWLRFPVLFLLITGVMACGYRLSGTGTALPPHLKTLAIPVFENKSTEPEIQRDLTNAIRESFINDGRVKIVDKSQADMIMNGVLTYYNLQAVSFTTQDVASEYFVELGVNVKVLDKVKDKLVLNQNLKTKWDFRTTADVINSESARQAALKEAYRDLANRLVSVLIDQF